VRGSGHGKTAQDAKVLAARELLNPLRDLANSMPQDKATQTTPRPKKKRGDACRFPLTPCALKDDCSDKLNTLSPLSTPDAAAQPSFVGSPRHRDKFSFAPFVPSGSLVSGGNHDYHPVGASLFGLGPLVSYDPKGKSLGLSPSAFSRPAPSTPSQMATLAAQRPLITKPKDAR
jgi:hypothetical protein